MKKLIFALVVFVSVFAISVKAETASPPPFMPRNYQELLAYALEHVSVVETTLWGGPVKGFFVKQGNVEENTVATQQDVLNIMKVDITVSVYEDVPGFVNLGKGMYNKDMEVLFYGTNQFEFVRDENGKLAFPTEAVNITMRMSDYVPIEATGIEAGNAEIKDEYGRTIGSEGLYVNGEYVYLPSWLLYNGYDLTVRLYDEEWNEFVYNIYGRVAYESKVSAETNGSAKHIVDLSNTNSYGEHEIVVNDWGNWVEPVLYTHTNGDESYFFVRIIPGMNSPIIKGISVRFKNQNGVWTKWIDIGLTNPYSISLNSWPHTICQFYVIAEPQNSNGGKGIVVEPGTTSE